MPLALCSYNLRCVCLQNDQWCLRDIINILQSVDWKHMLNSDLPVVKSTFTTEQKEQRDLIPKVEDTVFDHLTTLHWSFTSMPNDRISFLVSTTSTTRRSPENNETDITVVNCVKGLTKILDSRWAILMARK